MKVQMLITVDDVNPKQVDHLLYAVRRYLESGGRVTFRLVSVFEKGVPNVSVERKTS